MFERVKEAHKKRKTLTKKLIKHPFFPLLFIGEVIKSAVIKFAVVGAFLTPSVLALAITAFVVTLIWIYAEVFFDEIDETIDDINNE